MTTYPVQIIPPNQRIQFVDPKTGVITIPATQLLQQLWSLVVNSTPITPCTCTNTSNQYNLTAFPTPPSFQLPPYTDYAVYSFIAPAASTGSVTAQVNSLGILNVYKNPTTQAGNADIVVNQLYLLFYNSALNSGNGGFFLK